MAFRNAAVWQSSLALALVLGWAGCSSSGGGDGADDDGAADDDVADDAADDDGADDDDGDGDGDGTARYSLLVRGDRFTRLVVELDAVPGMEPYDETPDKLVELIADVVDKPDGVEAAIDGAIDPVGEDHAWTFDELRVLADDSFDVPLADDAIAIHVMFVDGHSADDSPDGVVLGIAWANTHIVIFKQTIDQVCAASVLPEALRDAQCTGAELSILTHEVGHLIGLVDNGLPMVEPHRDPDTAHGRHDADDGCVMYWAYEGGALFDAIGERLLGSQSNSVGFDDACLADLEAERGRSRAAGGREMRGANRTNKAPIPRARRLSPAPRMDGQGKLAPSVTVAD
jgi:hypothetical protein